MSSKQDASPTLRQRSDPPRGLAERLPPQWQNDIGSLAGKVVLITGSTRGIGRAAARAFAERSAYVIVHGRDKARAEAVAAEISATGGRAGSYAADLARPGEARRLVEATIREAGRLDLLINNGAVLPPLACPPWAADDAEWADVVATNVTAPFEASVAAVRWMLEAKRPGRIVNVSSEVANLDKSPPLGCASYGISKIALEGVAAYLAAEAGAFGIVVTTVRVPTSDTDMIKLRYDWKSRPPPRDPALGAAMYLWAATAPAATVHARIHSL
jgi:NAD(P)-dependent dehydrogenase (short-subunit alcohol dehydrogenase family)